MKALIVISVIFLVFLVSGCTDLEISDPKAKSVVNYLTNLEVQRAEKYTSEIVYNDIELRRQAAAITKDCNSGDKECEVNTIFYHIVSDYKYYSDPRSRELIQTPYDTINIGGGDCEDLTLLTSSLLENIGIKTYLVLSEEHAFSLACRLNVSKLWNYSKQTMLENIASTNAKLITKDGALFIVEGYQKVEILKRNHILFRGGFTFPQANNITVMDTSYSISSSEPVNVYIVPSIDEYNLFSENKKFDTYSKCSHLNEFNIDDKCDKISSSSGVIIENLGSSDAVLDLNINFYFYYPLQNLGENEITSYSINNETCVALDTTTGKYSYPGYTNTTDKLIIIDPVTLDQFYAQ